MRPRSGISSVSKFGGNSTAVKSVKSRLVRMSKDHLDATLTWLSDSNLRRRIDSLGVPSQKGHSRYWEAHWKDKRNEDYAILNSSGKHIGNCGLCRIDRERRKAELWIYLGCERASGFGSEAVRALLLRGFEQLNLNRISVRVLVDNVEAQSFFRSLGFVEEGKWREDTRFDGTYIDSLWFSVLAREYKAINIKKHESNWKD